MSKTKKLTRARNQLEKLNAEIALAELKLQEAERAAKAAIERKEFIEHKWSFVQEHIAKVVDERSILACLIQGAKEIHYPADTISVGIPRNMDCYDRVELYDLVVEKRQDFNKSLIVLKHHERESFYMMSQQARVTIPEEFLKEDISRQLARYFIEGNHNERG